MQSILITGGCGFIGLNLIGYLSKRGYTALRIIDNLTVGSREDLETYLSDHGRILDVKEQGKRMDIHWRPHGVEGKPVSVILLIEDVRDREAMIEAVLPGEAIVHLAAQTGVIESVEDPRFDCQVNVMGTVNLLEAAVKCGSPAFVFASSAAPMGDQPPPAREDTVPRPLSPYGASKLAGEGYCSAFSGSFGLPTCALRFSNVYGPYSTYKSSVIAKFFRQALLGETLVVFGDGNQTRDFIHTEDLCHLIYLALELMMERSASGGRGEIFQVATSHETSVNELFGMIQSLVEDDTDMKVHVEYEPPRPGEIYRNYADISKARSLLGFEPQISIKEGLRDTWAWFKTRFTPRRASPSISE
jgi:UDP-glucose 4-epimerase